MQPCQLTTKAQYKRTAALGMCANIFNNHLFYWCDQHHDTVCGQPDHRFGPRRAADQQLYGADDEI